LKVRLLTYTPHPIKSVFTAARTCYSPSTPTEIWTGDDSRERMHSLIDKVIGAGHQSVLEHISLTFSIEGISRSCSHQLVRHRIASFSQQSQRHVRVKKGGWVVPPSIENTRSAQRIFQSTLEEMHSCYERLIELGIHPEDARYLLPNAIRTNLVMTMNLRELYTVSEIRLCNRAQWEIRGVFGAIKGELMKFDDLRGFANHLQPICYHLGYCPEPKSCGLFPVKGETTVD
jgi:thymidylate synthase (FAD)